MTSTQKTTAAAVIAVLLIAGALYAVFFSSSGSPASQPIGANPYEIATDRALGGPDASVTVIEYASVTCGHCANFHAGVFKQLKETYIDTNKIRFIFRELPTAPAEWAKAGFLLARCIPEERYFGFIDVLFSKQAQWIGNPDVLKQIAQASGIDAQKFDQCIADEAELERLKAVVEYGIKEYGVQSTPTFVINSKTYENMSWEAFQAAIDPLLAE